MSVHLHMVSNKSREYFQAGISLSASAYSFWGIQTKKQAKYWTNWFAEVMNCPKRNTYALVESFRSRNPSFLVGRTTRLFVSDSFAKYVLQLLEFCDAVFFTFYRNGFSFHQVISQSN